MLLHYIAGILARRRLPKLPQCIALLSALGAAALIVSTPLHAAGRHASMVIDANTGQVLHQQSGDEVRYPASLTKMMTLYIAFELLEQGRLKSTTQIQISPEAAATAPSKLGLKPGAEIALGDALKIISVKSANDIAVAVAEHIAGSEDKFAALMTRKARQLGMNNTTFRNAHGLPHSEQVTTARDMLTLALRLSDDFPKQYAIFGIRTFSYGGVTFRNHNTMLSTYPGMDGLKTGYTTPSGFNLVASVRRDGRHLVAAVFGGTTASARNAHMRTILDRALLRASPERTRLSVPVARINRRDKPVAAAAPALREAPKRAERPRTVLAEPAQNGVAATPVSAPQVAVTKVRPIVVAPKSRPPIPVETAAPEPLLQSPILSAEAPHVPIQADMPVASEPTEPPAPHSPRLAAFSPAAHAPAAAMRGAAPSSLQAQAQRIERGEEPVRITAPVPAPAPIPSAPQRIASATLTSAQPANSPPPFRLKGPDTAPQSPSLGPAAERVVIQIGAYASQTEAQRSLELAREKARAALASATAITQPVQTGGRQLHRARFTGLDPVDAAKACIELRRVEIDCLVAKQ